MEGFQSISSNSNLWGDGQKIHKTSNKQGIFWIFGFFCDLLLDFFNVW